MTTPPRSESKVADLLAKAGHALYDSDDWPSQMARALDVRRDTIRKWMHDRLTIDRTHPIWRELRQQLMERRLVIEAAEQQLDAWLKEEDRT
jgi:hypothetical protein